MNRKLLFFCVAIAAIFSSCERDINIELPDEVSKITVNGLANVDSAWNVYVSKSLSVKDAANPIPITNATVLIKENGTLVAQLISKGDGYYTAASNPSIGHTYTIEASAKDLADVNAVCAVPHRLVTTITNAKHNVSAPANGGGGPGGGGTDLFTEITFNIADSLSANYYLIEIMQADTVAGFMYPACISTDNYILKQSNDASSQGECSDRFYVPDQLFDGVNTTFIVRVNELLPQPGTGYYLKVSSVSNEYFKYLQSIDAYKNNQGNPFSDPVQVYNNITNGFGIWGSVIEKWVKVN